MKRFLISSLIFLFLFTACKKENIKTIPLCFDPIVTNTNIAESFMSVFFITGNEGFVTGQNGGIYKTTDSAKTWITQNSTTTLPIRDIYFLNSNKGFAVGGNSGCSGTGCIVPGGFILQTQDGGTTWAKIYTPTEKLEISAITFIDNNKGFCIGINTIYKTIDGGQTWTENKINNIGGLMMDISFSDSQNGFIACLSDKVIRTTDGGTTWELTSPDKKAGYYSLSTMPGVVYMSGQQKIIKTINGGDSWITLPNSPMDIYALHFTDNNNGYAFGRGNYSGGDFGYSYGAIYCTADGGNSWNGSADIKASGIIVDVSFPTLNIGYAINANRIITIPLK